MKAEEVKTVAVLGAGVMGHGIAEVAAIAGCNVSLYDVKEDLLRSGLEKIKWSLDKLAEKKTLTAAASKEAFARIRGTLDLGEAVGNADVVIEAAPEDVSVKKDLFSKVERLAPRRSLLASNTSTLPISEIADGLARESSFVGMHFFNPPPVMPLLEVIRGNATGEEALSTAIALGKRFGKEVVVCRKDVPGFIVNRVLGPLLNEAAWSPPFSGRSSTRRSSGASRGKDSTSTWGSGGKGPPSRGTRERTSTLSPCSPPP
jgi:enoyl-CoA hydratase/3-hydroxyacyl-CoA dehydrogenase